jgi:hypothetical protein
MVSDKPVLTTCLQINLVDESTTGRLRRRRRTTARRGWPSSLRRRTSRTHSTHSTRIGTRSPPSRFQLVHTVVCVRRRSTYNEIGLFGVHLVAGEEHLDDMVCETLQVTAFVAIVCVCVCVCVCAC